MLTAGPPGPILVKKLISLATGASIASKQPAAPVALTESSPGASAELWRNIHAMHRSARLIHRLGLMLALAAIPTTVAVGQQNTTPTQRARGGLADIFEAKSIKMPDGSQRRYALFVPPQYDDDPSHRWPVILFLHGSVLRGEDGIRQTLKGLPKYIVSRPTRPSR